MGNKDSKGDFLEPDTLRNQAIYKTLTGKKPELDRVSAEGAWKGKVDDRLLEVILNFLFSKNQTVKFEEYNHFVTTLMKSTISEKAELLSELLLTVNAETFDQKLNYFVSILLTSAVRQEEKLPVQQNNIRSWVGENSEICTFQRLAEYFFSLCSSRSEDLGLVVNDIDRFITCALSPLFGNDSCSTSFFPRWRRTTGGSGDAGKPLSKCSVLTLEDILFLNMELPVDSQQEWRLLYTTKLHGESFSRLTGQIINQGPSILIVKDKDDHIFGGFAPASWSISPNFVGDASSFLFTLLPKQKIYPASNFNENFQYLNHAQQTLPNGLGMGGRLEYFGLWLSAEFGKGISNDSCTTYRNFKRLSKEKEFICAEVEVWGTGPPPPTPAELGERSVLDGNVETKAILEMAGKKTYSDGLRDAPPDLD